MSRMLYFMQVPWDWVRQRPHFLAEGLAARHDVTVVHNRPYTRFKLVRNERPPALRFKEPYLLPFAYLSRINAFLVSAQLRELLAGTDIVWLTHPFQYAQIGRAITPRHKVVYDCMDNNLEFAFVRNNPLLYSRLFSVEQELVRRSDIVVVSSTYLGQILEQRYNLHKEAFVVNNGIFLGDGRLPGTTPPASPRKLTTISYIGTIAEWFDFDLVLASLARYENLVYDLYGPAEVPIPRHDRLNYRGRIEHRFVFDAMQRSDALVMPFKLNELVLAINPVKLYEYVYSHKPAIAVRYCETEQFGEFVHLYDSAEEYLRLVDQLVEGSLAPKKPEADCVRFAGDNTWERRAAEIAEILGKCSIR